MYAAYHTVQQYQQECPLAARTEGASGMRSLTTAGHRTPRREETIKHETERPKWTRLEFGDEIRYENRSLITHSHIGYQSAICCGHSGRKGAISSHHPSTTWSGTNSNRKQRVRRRATETRNRSDNNRNINNPGALVFGCVVVMLFGCYGIARRHRQQGCVLCFHYGLRGFLWHCAEVQNQGTF